ncbi:MAG TPA: glycosyltransferase family protein [Gracilimonas sp.]|uniref:glycosyltransferase family protein n=1 Tax=Gracilimonas sp. TaxID=1974203 RepID=UPI002D92E3CA|nr:glycosyltransferase family protein [Gracilimonas sp.]
MRILYGVQGTGHGHISRARVVLPKLREYAEVDVLISGYNFKMNIDGPVDFTARGMSLAYDNSGSVDFLETALNLHPFKFLKDVRHVPIGEYDFVVNDFEPVTAWAANQAGIPCVAISHQASFLSEKSPRPDKRSAVAENVMRYFAPSTAAVGSHYLRYDDFIEPPIIRRHIRDLHPSPGDHVTVYLPAFDHQTLHSIFSQVKKTKWHIFSPTCEEAYVKGNVQVNPVGKEDFLKSIEHCLGVISATGFETTSEAMFLGKKLLTIPIKNQYEQLCNAAALEEMGGKVVYQIDPYFSRMLSEWIDKGAVLSLPEISDEEDLVQKIIQSGLGENLQQEHFAQLAVD